MTAAAGLNGDYEVRIAGMDNDGTADGLDLLRVQQHRRLHLLRLPREPQHASTQAFFSLTSTPTRHA